MSLVTRWQARTRRRSNTAAARRVVAEAETQLARTGEVLAYAQWLHERWPGTRLVLSRPSRTRTRVELAYAGRAPQVVFHGMEVNHLYRLARHLLEVGESRVVHPVLPNTDLAQGHAASS